jgi:ELWxxDGT repeat protein
MNPYGITDSTGFNGLCLFTANDGVHGLELWRTDGTFDGTYMLQDINPGVNGSLIQGTPLEGLDYNGVFYFAADDGGAAYGRELWRTDGTVQGTVLDGDYNPGPAGSDPRLLRKVNPLFFVADTPLGVQVILHGSAAPAASPAVDGLVPIPTRVLIEDPAIGDSGATYGLFTVGDVRVGGAGAASEAPVADDDSPLERPGWSIGADDSFFDRLLADLDEPDSGDGSGGSRHLTGLCDLNGYDSYLRDGAAIVFNLLDIEIADLFCDSADMAFFADKHDEIDLDAMDELTRLLAECAGRCTGRRSFIEALQSSTPVGVR